MSTRIDITVSNNQLVEKNQRDPEANRYEFILRQQEDELARRLGQELDEQEAEEEVAAQEGAIPEYRVKEETSAKRKEQRMGGWLDVNWMHYREFAPGSKEKIRINVGCGNGSKWKSVDIDPEFPIFPSTLQPGPVQTIQGVMIRYDAVFPPVDGDSSDPPFPITYPPPPDGAYVITKNPFEDIPGNDPTNGGIGIFGNEDTWKEWIAGTYFDNYLEDRNLNVLDLKVKTLAQSAEPESIPRMSYLVYPVNDEKAILTVRNYWTYSKEYTEGVTAEDGGRITLQNTGFPEFTAPKVVFDIYWQVPEGGAIIPSYPYFGYQDSRQLQVFGSFKISIYYLFVKELEPEDPSIAFEYYLTYSELLDAYPSLQTGPPTVQHREYGPVNYAFSITHDQVKEIEFPTLLEDKYDERFPAFPWVSTGVDRGFYDGYSVLPDWAPDFLGGYEEWIHLPASSYMGAGNARYELPFNSSGEGPNFGVASDVTTPQTYQFGTPGIYDYVESDFRDPDFWESFIQSDYAPASGTPIFSPDPFMPKSGFNFARAVYPNNNSGGYNIYKYLFLKTEEREDSPLHSAATENTEGLLAPRNPAFYYSYFRQTSAGLDYFYNDMFSDTAPLAWFPADESVAVPTNRWRPAREYMLLRSNRVLPPNLANTDYERTTHPYIDLWDGAEFNESGGLIGTVVDTHLSTIAWTGWGRNWSSKLKALGFTGF